MSFDGGRDGKGGGRSKEEGKLNEPSGVVDDVLDDTSNVTVPLGEVESTKSRGLLPVVGVGLKGGKSNEGGKVKRVSSSFLPIELCSFSRSTESSRLTLKIPPDFLWFKMTRCEGEEQTRKAGRRAGGRGREDKGQRDFARSS